MDYETDVEALSTRRDWRRKTLKLAPKASIGALALASKGR